MDPTLKPPILTSHNHPYLPTLTVRTTHTPQFTSPTFHVLNLEGWLLRQKVEQIKTNHSFIYKLTMHKYFFTSSPLFVGSVPTESCQPTKPERLSFSEQSTSSDIPLNFIETSLLEGLSLVVKDRNRIDSGGNFKRLAEFQLVKAMPITFYFARN